MGVTISSLWARLFGKKEIKIMMVGLDAAGKTTILYKLKMEETVRTMPTIGFNVETLMHNNIYFTVWDVGAGGDKLRPLWYHFYQKGAAVIFVVDSSDRERVEEAGYEIKYLLDKDELQDAILLVLANKQDLPTAMTIAELTDKLRLNELGSRTWFIQPTCATQGQGLHQALDWLSNELLKNE